MNVKITILDSIVNEDRKECCFKVLKSFYSKVISRIYGFKKLETILNENINDIQAFQKNGYDCGAFSIYHLHKFLFKNYFASEFPPEKHSEIGIFYRKIIFSKASDVFDDSGYYDEKQNDDEFIDENGNGEDVTLIKEIKVDAENVKIDYNDTMKNVILVSKSQISEAINLKDSMNIPSPKSECSFRKDIDYSTLKSTLSKDFMDEKATDDRTHKFDDDYFSMPPEDNDFVDESSVNKLENSFEKDLDDTITFFSPTNKLIKEDENQRIGSKEAEAKDLFDSQTTDNSTNTQNPKSTFSASPYKKQSVFNDNRNSMERTFTKITKISQYMNFKLKYSYKQNVDELEEIALKHLNKNMKAGVRAILNLPVSFSDSLCVTWKRVSHNHIRTTCQKKDIDFEKSWKNFVNELISKGMIYKRFDEIIIRNEKMIFFNDNSNN